MRRVSEVSGQPTLEEVRAFWDSNPLFTGESRHSAGTPEFFEEHESTVISEHSGRITPIFTRDVRPGADVLDVGCGIGFWVGLFSRLGANVSACDLTERGVQMTRRRLELAGHHADVRQGNAESLPYREESFDHVNCQGVIHHTPDPSACVREFHRVLRKNGTLCLSVYYKTAALRSELFFKTATLASRPLLRMRGRGRENMFAAASPEELVRLYDGAANPLGIAYTRAEFRALLTGRFEVIEQWRLGFPRRAFPLPMPDVVHRLLGNMLGLMIVFRCRKVETERRSEEH